MSDSPKSIRRNVASYISTAFCRSQLVGSTAQKLIMPSKDFNHHILERVFRFRLRLANLRGLVLNRTFYFWSYACCSHKISPFYKIYEFDVLLFQLQA